MNKFERAMDFVTEQVRQKGAEAVAQEIRELMEQHQLLEGPTLADVALPEGFFACHSEFDESEVSLQTQDVELELYSEDDLEYYWHQIFNEIEAIADSIFEEKESFSVSECEHYDEAA